MLVHQKRVGIVSIGFIEICQTLSDKSFYEGKSKTTLTKVMKEYRI